MRTRRLTRFVAAVSASPRRVGDAETWLPRQKDPSRPVIGLSVVAEVAPGNDAPGLTCGTLNGAAGKAVPKAPKNGSADTPNKGIPAKLPALLNELRGTVPDNAPRPARLAFSPFNPTVVPFKALIVA
jgi:hypothetical protein